MKKHQFVKTDCNCAQRATYFTCKFCGTVEYCSQREIRALDALRAVCTSLEAPDVPPVEKFRTAMGGTFDCLAPDFETWEAEKKAREGAADASKPPS